MIVISDILYFASIDDNLHQLITSLYQKDPEAFKAGSSLLFDLEQRNRLYELVGIPVAKGTEKYQRKLNHAMGELCSILHKQLSPQSREFLHSKGITDNQIDRYHIGDSMILESHFDEVFHNLSHKHNDETLELVQNCLTQYRAAIVDRYQNPVFISYPSYTGTTFTGAVFRTLGFEKREGQLRNMFKFYSPYNYSYLFNEGALEEYDEINVVEGVSDALTLIRLGYPNTISPSMVRLSPKHIHKLANKQLNILFDQDMGGYAGAKYIMERIPAEQLNVVALTPNTRDFDEEDESVIHSYMSHLSEFDIRKHM